MNTKNANDNCSNSVVDQDVRDELLNIDQSFIVQAPAGSGKTELLTQRILALLASVKKPESILAITFTRKAAAEMRDRVISALILAQDEPPESPHELARWKLANKVLKVDQKNGWNLIANPNRLNLYTIDALSASLSGALPLLSQTGTIPAIEEKAFGLYREAAENMMASISHDDSVATNIKTLLTHKDNNLKQVIELIAQLLDKRLQWLGRIDPEDHQMTSEQLFDSLSTIIEEKLQSVYAAFPTSIISELPKLLKQASEVLTKSGKSKAVHLMRNCHYDAIGQPIAADLDLWKAIADMLLTSNPSKPSFYKSPSKTNGFPTPKDAENDSQAKLFEQNKQTLKNILHDLADNFELVILLNEVRLLPDDIDTAIENPVLQSVIELLPFAASHLKLVFQESNVLDFSELSLSSIDALGSEYAPTDIALALDYKIEHILVDEFQDTSSPQIRLIELLTAGWDEASHKSLFLVGDPMQSIYRFRDANVSLFMQIVEFGIGQLQPKFRQLQVNFRSNQNIIDWVNEQFGRVMPLKDDLTLSAVSYAPSTAFYQAEASSQVKCFVTLDANNHLEQAKKIRQVIAEHLTKNSEQKAGEPLKTLAILAKSRGHLVEIIEQLNRYSINYQAVDIEPITNKMVVNDVTNLALALSDVYDQLSWVACFRSPWFGLSLNDVHIILNRLKNSQQSIPTVVNEVALSHSYQSNHSNEANQPNDSNELSQSGKKRILKILPLLNCAIKQKGKKPFIKWLSGCFEAVGGLLQIDIASEHQDLKTCIETIAEFESGGEIIDRLGLQQALDGLYAAPNPQADHQVQIMTIHKSKGLEFDRVILPRLDAMSISSDAPLLKWSEVIDSHGHAHNLLAVSKQAGKNNDSIYQYISYLEKQKDQYESQRVLYVAATRAKSELYLFGNISTDTKANKSNDLNIENTYKRPSTNSFLSMLWGGVKNNLQIIGGVSESSMNESGSALNINPARINETELARIADLNTQKSQLEYIFPTRKIKRSNIDKVETLAVGDDLFFQQKFDFNNDASQIFNGLEIAEEQTVSYSVAAMVGTVIHRQLEWLSKQSAQQNIADFSLPDHWKEITVRQLVDIGLNQSEVNFEKHVDSIISAISNTLSDKMGRFILDHHTDAKSELKLQKNIAHGVFLTRIIDRTFISDQVRWIVDYKSAVPMVDEALPDFLKREVDLYRNQMTEYVELFKSIENRKIIAGLYFPMIQHFEKVYTHPT